MKPVAGPVVQIDEGRIQAHLDEVVRSTVEETLNALLDAEADRLCGAQEVRAQRGPQGHARRQLRSSSAHQGRRSDVNSPEAAQLAV